MPKKKRKKKVTIGDVIAQKKKKRVNVTGIVA